MENGHTIDRIRVLEAELARCQEDCHAAKHTESISELFRDSVQDYAFITLDLENRIVGWSRGAEYILGYQTQEALGQCGSIFFTPEDVANGAVERELLLAQAEGRAEDERWHQKKDGERFWASGVMVPLRDPAGRQQGFGKIFRDLTARRQMEERLTASVKEKEVLLREIHHRVKNNLQVIISLISLQARLNAPPEMKPYFDELEGRVRAIAALHESLYSSPDLGSILFSSYMEQLLREVLSFHGVDPHRIALELSAADVAINIEQALPLGLILNELITNCLKHAFPDQRRGVVTVSLQYVRSAAHEMLDNAHCELSVSDDGIGLRAQDVVKSKSMGLRIVQLLVSELGGTFHVDNESLRGAKFTVRFPLQQDLHEADSQAALSERDSLSELR